MSNYDPNFKPVKQYAIVGQKVVISNSEGKILLLQRSNKSGAGGKWSIAGGGLDKGEKSEDGILREIKEEIQITVSDLRPFFVKSYMNNDDFIVIIGYEAKYKSGEVALNWEHDDYQWVSKKEALAMDLTPDARDLISEWEG
ncbi:MAG: NUDIX hydrolase [Candidatus Pacebacteria bacterium]|nr:NUDIX hydrolase [Candidatus Paceibacterota bacterium]MBT6921396.1 NUDIX hydrolase [Candidatus Paceibacterota bacterium]